MDETLPQEQNEAPNQIPHQTPLRRPVMSYSEQSEQKKERITKITAGALLSVAILIDLIKAILNLLGVGDLFVGSVISVGGDVIFLVWFWILGVSFSGNTKKIVTMAVQGLIGLIPFIDTLPELTVGILILILITRSEDKGGMLGKVAGAAQTVSDHKISNANNARADNIRRAQLSKPKPQADSPSNRQRPAFTNPTEPKPNEHDKHDNEANLLDLSNKNQQQDNANIN